jgi:hypothetical protein
MSSNPVFNALKKALPLQLLTWPLGLWVGMPTDPYRVPFLEGCPMDLKALYTAGSSPEAEMLRQVLIDAGFHVEYVPSPATGVFGVTGNSTIYVPAGEFDAATQFLGEYLSPPQ